MVCGLEFCGNLVYVAVLNCEDNLFLKLRSLSINVFKCNYVGHPDRRGVRSLYALLDVVQSHVLTTYEEIRVLFSEDFCLLIFETLYRILPYCPSSMHEVFGLEIVTFVYGFVKVVLEKGCVCVVDVASW